MGFTPLMFASIMAGIDIIAFSIIKKVSQHAIIPGLAIISMGLYSLQPMILLQALSVESVVIMNILWNLLSSIFVTLFGIFILGETIGTYKLIGVLLGIISLFLCTFENNTTPIQKYLPHL